MDLPLHARLTPSLKGARVLLDRMPTGSSDGVSGDLVWLITTPDKATSKATIAALESS